MTREDIPLVYSLLPGSIDHSSGVSSPQVLALGNCSPFARRTRAVRA